MNNTFDREIIFASTEIRASIKLQELRMTFEKDGEQVFKSWANELKTDKRTVIALVYGEHCRGYRYRKAYIDVKLKLDEFEMIKMKQYPNENGNYEDFEFFDCPIHTCKRGIYGM